MENLREIQKHDNEINEFSDHCYKMVMVVKTKWNTLHDMLKRILLLFENVNRSLIALKNQN